MTGIIYTELDERWMQVRSERNAKLTACDWTQLPDVDLTEEEKLAWKNYRQSLRDIFNVFDNPDDAVFPQVP